jgi:cytidylate kinase
MKEIICISGDLCSGKSTVGRALAEELGYEYFSAGIMFRNIAREKGVDVLQLNKICENEMEIDKLIDGGLEEMEKTRSKIIVDARMGWHFIKDSFKVYLTIEIEEAARRVMKDKDRYAEQYKNFDEAVLGLSDREEAEAQRYFKKYGVHIQCQENYHLKIDTTRMSAWEIQNLIINEYKKYLEGDG